MKHKGGYTYGSIYERRRAGKELSYTAEIQFQGQKIRRSSKDIYIRMRILRTTVADIELLAYVDKDIESKLHAEYKAKRVKGEWFKLTGEDVEKIISEHGFKGGGCFP